MKLSLNSFFWERQNSKVPAKQVHFSTCFFSSQAHVMYVFKCDWRAFILVRDFSLPLSKTDRYRKGLRSRKRELNFKYNTAAAKCPLLTFYNCSYGTCYIDFEHSILPCKKRSSDHEHISLWTSLSVSQKMARSWKLLTQKFEKALKGLFRNFQKLCTPFSS